MTEPVKGPASYFPSIEKTYGRSTELMALLKTEYGMGHGHADALFVLTLKEDESAG